MIYRVISYLPSMLLQQIQLTPKEETLVQFITSIFNPPSAELVVSWMKAIPVHITEIHLSSNQLYNLGVEGLVSVMNAIPVNVTAIHLPNNALGKFSVEELISVMKATPAQVTTLDLSGNELNTLGAEGLVTVMTAIPLHVTAIHLGDNQLYKLGIEGLVSVMKTIFVHVMVIHLPDNALGHLSVEGLVSLMKAIPAHANALDLSGNQLNELGVEGLVSLMKAIPAHVTALDLSWNELNELGAEGLVSLMKSLPNKITTINVDDNYLHYEHLMLIIKNVPPTLHTFNLLKHPEQEQPIPGNAFEAAPIFSPLVTLIHDGLNQHHFMMDLIENIKGTNITKIIGISSPELSEVLKQNLVLKKNRVIALSQLVKKGLPQELVGEILTYTVEAASSGPSKEKSRPFFSRAHDLANYVVAATGFFKPAPVEEKPTASKRPRTSPFDRELNEDTAEQIEQRY